jgi:vacuolar protein sorting-associated protein 26
MFGDKETPYKFTSLTQELTYPGELRLPTMYPFEFRHVEKLYESYYGINVHLRYFVRVTVLRKAGAFQQERDIWVYALTSTIPTSLSTASILMEVGIEDCLHLEFEYDKSAYELKDVILGKISFLMVRIRIRLMEISIIRREIVGSDAFTANETVSRFEIMDGSPVKGEYIPIRIFLSGFDLTPTFRDVCMKFSVKYFLNLVLLDEDDRRYFKQQQILLYRKPT